MKTRREFVIASGAASASVLATAVPAIASETSAEAPAWDEEFDVIVVGAGIAGCTTALTVARDGNGSSCLVVEKGTVPSGCSPYCAGRCLWTNDVDAMKLYLKAMAQGSTPDEVLDTFAEGMAEIPDWLYSWGATEADLTIVQPGTDGEFGSREPEHPECEGSYSIGVLSFGGSGATNPDAPTHILNFLLDKIEENSDCIDLRYETPAERLVKGPDGAVEGIVAGGKRIKATKGVVMCLGGFEHNEKMLECYTGVGAAKSSAGKGNTGDGILMCQEVGTGFWHMHGGAIYWMGGRDLENSYSVGSDKMYGITVGTNGRRFYMDWDACKINIEKEGYPYLSDPRTHVGYRHGMTQFGGDWRHLPMPDIAWYIFDEANLSNAIPENLSSDPLADNIVVCADTLEELAAKIDVPAEELVNTVNHWNESCEQGIDMAFYRPEKTLIPITEGPFYAQLCAPSMLNTDGGPVRNKKAEILDPFGEPITGLFSAGEFGSVWGGKYQGCGNVAECIVFGRIAAQSALAR